MYYLKQTKNHFIVYKNDKELFKVSKSYKNYKALVALGVIAKEPYEA